MVACFTHEIRREGQAALGAADRDNLVFERLAQDFEGVLAEFGQLIQEEHPAVSQADLPWPWPIAAAHQACVGNGAARRAKGPLANERRVTRQHVGHRVDARGVQRLGEGQPGQDGGQGAGHERLAGTRRAAHQTLWPPAAATSSVRLTCSCPQIPTQLC